MNQAEIELLELEAEMLTRRLAANRLSAFVDRCTPGFKDGWHIREICAAVEQIEQQIQAGTGTDARLIVEAPPRHGKSQVISRCTPLWYLGRHPSHEIIVATYAQDLADDLGRWAKGALTNPAIAAVFPDLKLRTDSRAANRLDTTAGGGIRYVGIGGPITGRGAHLCLAAGTMVPTRHRGDQRIEDILPGDLVLTHRLRWRRVAHVHDNGVRPVRRYGNVVCTDDHLVYTSSGWRRADAAEEIAHVLPETVQELRTRPLGGAGGEEDKLHQEPGLLFHRLPCRAPEGHRLPADTARKGVPGLLRYVPPCHAEGGVLLETVPESQASEGDGRGGEPELLARSADGGTSQALPQGVQPDASYGASGLLALRPEDRACGASSERERAGRPAGECGGSVPGVPHDVPQDGGPRDSRVYCLTVDEDHSFVCRDPDCGADSLAARCLGLTGAYAVVSNCLVDDPIKGAEDADSELMSTALWEWYSSVLRTRLAPGGGIIVLHTRWRVNDLIGRLLQAQAAGEGEKFKRITFSAIAKPNDPWGRKEGEPLHPERYGIDDLRALQMALPPRDWLALYQQDPMLDEGNIFKVTDFQLYKPGTAPRNLYWYIACDLGASAKKSANPSVVWPFGIDADGCIWFSPDFVHTRMDTSQSIGDILRFAKDKKVHAVIIEGGQIMRSIEPELKRRMRENNVYFQIINPAPTKDKYVRSRPAHARMTQGMIRYPDTRYVREKVIPQFLFFTGINDDEDDLVDAVAWAAHATDEMVLPVRSEGDDDPDHDEEPPAGSYADILRRCPIDDRRQRPRHVPEPLRAPRAPRGRWRLGA